MNACEDQSEPLGEHIDTFEAIQRGAVVGILFAADAVLATKQLAERQGQALNAVRQIHHHVNLVVCGDCGEDPDGPGDCEGSCREVVRRVCAVCCFDGGYQSEFCAEDHDHSEGAPICRTIRAIDEAGA